MGLRLALEDVSELRPGIWEFELPPHQIRSLGSVTTAVGDRSVLLFRECHFDRRSRQLSFGIEDVTPINVGTSGRTIGIDAKARDASENPSGDSSSAQIHFGPGDQEFLHMARRELSPAMAQTAERLLTEVRRRSAGNLKKGKSRNFSDTPDNFWYVILQPRIDKISVTVRGSVSHFEKVAKLEVKDDRGNTRFKVRGDDDIPNAVELIFHATRKT